MFESLSRCLQNICCTRESPKYSNEYLIATHLLFSTDSYDVEHKATSLAVQWLGIAIRKCVNIERYNSLNTNEQEVFLSQLKNKLSEENLVFWNYNNDFVVCMGGPEEGVCVLPPNTTEVNVTFLNMPNHEAIPALENSISTLIQEKFPCLFMEIVFNGAAKMVNH